METVVVSILLECRQRGQMFFDLLKIFSQIGRYFVNKLGKMKSTIGIARSKDKVKSTMAQDKKFSLRNLVTIALETLSLSLLGHVVILAAIDGLSLCLLHLTPQNPCPNAYRKRLTE
jgi:hypothetical protein